MKRVVALPEAIDAVTVETAVLALNDGTGAPEPSVVGAAIVEMLPSKVKLTGTLAASKRRRLTVTLPTVTDKNGSTVA